MNKHESKYYNTAKLMDEALIILLDKKEYELITIKDICVTAGVNRSTFYLHYESIEDLLKECINESIKDISNRFIIDGKNEVDLTTNNLDDLVFITSDYIIPYLEFIKDNKKLFKIAHKYPNVFNTDKSYTYLFKNVFNPILQRFGYNDEDTEYIMEYFIKGTTALILKWASNDCKEDILKICDLIKLCIRPEAR